MTKEQLLDRLQWLQERQRHLKNIDSILELEHVEEMINQTLRQIRDLDNLYNK